MFLVSRLICLWLILVMGTNVTVFSHCVNTVLKIMVVVVVVVIMIMIAREHTFVQLFTEHCN